VYAIHGWERYSFPGEYIRTGGIWKEVSLNNGDRSTKLLYLSREMFRQFVTFTAPEFIPSFATEYTARVALRWFTHRKWSASEALAGDSCLGVHSGVVVFNAVKPTWYTWSQASTRPFGKVLPIQCSICGWLDKIRPCKNQPGKGALDVMCTQGSCTFRQRFFMPTGARWESGHHGEGGWIASSKPLY
jgi:hypothetical protein